MTRADRRRLLQRLAFSKSPHLSWDNFPANTMAYDRATLQLAICELQYVLQNIVINILFGNDQLILVFLFLFSVALAQNTTGITTATTMAATGRNGPLAPHMRPWALCRRVKWMGDNTPSLRM